MSPRWLVDPAAVVLGTVAPEQRELARNLIAQDAEFRGEVERLRRLSMTLSELPGSAWEPAVADPPALDEAVLDAARDPAPAPASPPAPAVAAPAPRPRRRRRLAVRPVLAAAAAVVLLALGVGAGLLLAEPGGDERAAPAADTDPWVLATLRPLPGDRSAASGRVALTLRPDGRARLRLRDLPPLPPDGFYEAWLLRDRTDLVALGTFRPDTDGRASLDVGFGVDPRRYRFVDVSRQGPQHGARHSGDSVLRTEQLG